MKKSVVLKGLLAVLFVFVAGVFYISATKGEEKMASGPILREEAGQAFGVGELSQTGDGDLSDLDDLAGEKEGAEVSVYVHVCGAVKEPGVYALPEGSRVADAILCAGDFLPGAAKDYLNLAKPVLDGQKIYVPDEEEAEQIKETGGGAALYEDVPASMEEPSYVNINTAGESELMTLPGIGKAKADAIVAYRKEHGAFSSCEELMQVPGIKESVYEKLRDTITVGR